MTRPSIFSISKPQNSAISVSGLHRIQQMPDFMAQKNGEKFCREEEAEKKNSMARN